MQRRLFILGAAVTCVASWLSAAWAQQAGRTYRLAVVHPSRTVETMTAAAAPLVYGVFFEALAGHGYVEGRNLAVERYSGLGKDPNELAELLRSAAARKPDVMFVTAMDLVVGNTPVPVPLVHIGLDPIGWGLTASLAHPDRNITGVAITAAREIYAKHFQLLRELIPTASRIGCLTIARLWNEAGADMFGPLRQAVSEAGASLIPAIIDPPYGEDAYRAGFAAMAEQRVEALIVTPAISNWAHQRLIAELAAHARLPAIYPERTFVDAGGLMSYGGKQFEYNRRAGDDDAQILGGATPADIPFYQANRFELVINMKAAKALGVTIPAMLQAGADDLIE